MLTGSADSMNSELDESGIPVLSTTYGLGRTPPSAVNVPGVSPEGVFGLQPVGFPVVPKEMAPPATAT
jgi:hypothetical protein